MMFWFAVLTALGTQQEATVTRMDLARCLLRLERAMVLAPLAADKVAEANVAFDRATLAFFAGSFQQAIEQIDRLTGSLDPGFGSPGARVAASVRWKLVPPFAPANQQVALELKCSPIYALADTAGETKLTVKLIDPTGAEQKEYPVTVSANRTTSAEILLPEKGLDVGTYTLALWSDDADTAVSLRLPVLPSAPEQAGSEATARLRAITKTDPKLTDAMASCLARARVMTSPFDTEHELCTDLPAMMSDLAMEVAKLEAGTNPYVGKTGDTWRVRTVSGKEAPFRVYAPPAAPGGGPRPLVVAFHGAGGDEHMFFNSYGSGMLRVLAQKHGFVVVTPRTTDYLGKPAEVRKLVELVSAEQGIDRTRVYVLGHSLGGGLASQLATEMSDVFAAACCLASAFGMPKGDVKKAAPTLVITGQKDAVVPAAGVKALVEKVQQASLPVELVSVDGYGHTLLVGAQLPFAVEWLLGHRLTGK
ncbi:MAG: alpha/beta fold hydrolase [Fimbriimonadia bacterium]|jgi:predicted esterase